VRLLLCLLIALAGSAWSATAGAQNPADAGRPALHRFIGSDGLGLGTARRSDLDALWGRADVEKPMGSLHGPPERKRWLLLEYKSRGLLFKTTPGSYGSSDPPLDTAYFSEPFDGCTPQGLCIGMPQDAAMAIIQAHYKITGDNAASFGRTGQVKGRTYSARNKGWRKTHYMSFGFADGRLHSMYFQLQPSPFVSARTVRGVIGWTVLLAVVIGGSILLRPYRRQLQPVWKAAKVGLVLYALASVAMGLVVLYALFGGK
jgi:hypothetical protein